MGASANARDSHDERPDDEAPDVYQTDWSMIFAAISEEDSADGALSRVVQRYWPAIFAYVRAAGVPEHEASDVTQGFVCDVVLGRKLLETADPERGRFRSLLLQALRHYLSDRHRRRVAQKRHPKDHHVVALEEVSVNGTMADTTSTPEQEFCAQWGKTLVRRVLEQVRKQCVKDGLGTHWEIFEARVVRPKLVGDPVLEYRELMQRLPLRSQSQAANMMVTVKRRFAAALRQEVASTLTDPADVAAEIADLMRDLEHPS